MNDLQNFTMGMEKEQYDQKASAHSKANIFLWITGGIIFNIYQGNLFSISTALLIIPGIFVASFASLLTFLVEAKKLQILPHTDNVLVLLFFTVWYAIDLIYPIALAIGYVWLIEYLFQLLY